MIQIVEEDLFFPGKPVHQPEDDTTDAISPLSRSSSITSVNGRRGRELPPSIPEGESGDEQRHLDVNGGTDLNTITPTPNSKFPEIPPLSGINGGLDHFQEEDGAGSPPEDSPQSSILVLPHSRAASRPKLPGVANGGHDHIQGEHNPGRATGPPDSPESTTPMLPHSRAAARPKLSLKPTGPNGHGRSTTILPKHSASSLADSTVSLLNSLSPSNQANAPPSSEKQDNFYRRRRSSSNLTTGRDSTHSNQASPPASSPQLQPPASPKAPFLLRTPSRAVPSPRDHSLLEYIYHEMLSSRFINSSPLALLSTYLEYHFKGESSILATLLSHV